MTAAAYNANTGVETSFSFKVISASTSPDVKLINWYGGCVWNRISKRDDYSQKLCNEGSIEVADEEERLQMGDSGRVTKALHCILCALGYGEASGLNHVAKIFD